VEEYNYAEAALRARVKTLEDELASAHSDIRGWREAASLERERKADALALVDGAKRQVLEDEELLWRVLTALKGSNPDTDHLHAADLIVKRLDLPHAS
jgi:hypothetical protein